jgi:tripartite-type tricarboxylate transporter receptor subunit TctC
MDRRTLAQPEAKWPSKPVKCVEPFASGGAMDVIAQTRR